jgi:hypothetical protein
MRTISLPGGRPMLRDESLDATLSIVLPLTAIGLLPEEGGSRKSGEHLKYVVITLAKMFPEVHREL